MMRQLTLNIVLSSVHKVNIQYCKKYWNTSFQKVLQLVLQYFFYQVLLLLLQYFLPVLLTTMILSTFVQSSSLLLQVQEEINSLSDKHFNTMTSKLHKRRKKL